MDTHKRCFSKGRVRIRSFGINLLSRLRDAYMTLESQDSWEWRSIT